MVIVAIWGALISITPLASYHAIAIPVVFLGLFSLIGVCIAGILSWNRGFRPARFFIIAWFGMLSV